MPEYDALPHNMRIIKSGLGSMPCFFCIGPLNRVCDFDSVVLFIVNPERTKILYVLIDKVAKYGPVGGWGSIDETLIETAMRELREELLDLDENARILSRLKILPKNTGTYYTYDGKIRPIVYLLLEIDERILPDRVFSDKSKSPEEYQETSERKWLSIPEDYIIPNSRKAGLNSKILRKLMALNAPY